MARREPFSFPAVGGSSLLAIFSVLCLVVLALLSLSTALAEQRLAEASLAAVSGYYEADCRAEEIYAQLRQGHIPGQVQRTGNYYSYHCPISDTQRLCVLLEHSGGHWHVLQWQAVSDLQPEETDAPAVWDGTSP